MSGESSSDSPIRKRELPRTKKSSTRVRIVNIKNVERFTISVSSLRKSHANLLCIVPILVYVLPKQVLAKLRRTSNVEAGSCAT